MPPPLPPTPSDPPPPTTPTATTSDRGTHLTTHPSINFNITAKSTGFSTHLVVVLIGFVRLPQICKGLEIRPSPAALVVYLQFMPVLEQPPAKYAREPHGVNDYHEPGIHLEGGVSGGGAAQAVVRAEVALPVVETVANEGLKNGVGDCGVNDEHDEQGDG